ncbi:hypothetical protein BB561_000546 [Smittium simulii]|uniref:NADH dehydrogenase [ubiquinone] 1 alpha subcomplex subunit 5 n=1 Tax=Smittium simulii TaxID=133385 RepID=A0A2T9YYM2_9FUNG|nr:hypothetical protein BB561_000546 [Smittium simulii]
MLFSRTLFQAASKKTTGLFGVPVNPNARSELISIYKQTLAELKQKIPTYAVYRQATESITLQRLAVAESNEDVNKIESLLNTENIEELVMVAEDELKLVDFMAECKPWEPLEEPPVKGQWDYFKKAPEFE